MTRDWLLVVFAISTPTATLSAQENAPRPTQPAPAVQPQTSAVGIGALIRPVKTDGLNLTERAGAIPQEKKDRVHFFLINGLDPLYAGNLNGVAAYFRSIGFANTSCHQFPAASNVRRQIESLRRSDKEARIVLLGYSVGANVVRGLANTLQRDGIYIDCLIYLGGDTVFNTASSKPGNVGQIVNVTGHGMIFLGRDIYFKGDDIDGAVNRRVRARHITLPAQREVMDVIGQAVLGVAANPRGQQAAIESAPTVQPASARSPNIDRQQK